MRKQIEENPMILAQTGPFDGQRWVIDKELIIGRDDDCDIIIPNRQVSRHHARLYQNSKGVWVEDLGSKNGTHFNGNSIDQPVLLQDGDIIQIAYTQQFVFVSSDATMPLDGDFERPRLITQPGETRLLRLEKKSRRVWVKNTEIVPPLSVSQYKLLETLYEQPGQVVSRSKIIEGIWGQEHAIAVSDQALDALVRRLRDRLAEADPTHQYIVTVRGHGLRLENPGPA
jgi:pSer/pThr/pTyr-binding forkhead associated (FHA) protein